MQQITKKCLHCGSICHIILNDGDDGFECWNCNTANPLFFEDESPDEIETFAFVTDTYFNSI